MKTMVADRVLLAQDRFLMDRLRSHAPDQISAKNAFAWFMGAWGELPRVSSGSRNVCGKRRHSARYATGRAARLGRYADPDVRRLCLPGIAVAIFVWTTIPLRAEVGDAHWAKEAMEYATKLPPLKIPGSPILMVGADEQYKDVASAIAALPPEGGTVQIAKGKYEISESLRVPSHAALIGEEKGTSIQMKSGIFAHVITNADHEKGNTDILLRDLAIVGNLDSKGTAPVGHPTQGNDNCRGIYFKRVSGARVLNCFITETGSNSLLAENCRDIALVHSEELFCFHCLNFTNCKNVTVAYYRAVRKWSGEAPYFNSTHNSKVFKNYVEGMGMDGMAFDFGSSFNEIRDNVVAGCFMSGVLLFRNANNNIIRDNLIKNNGRYKKNPQGRMDGIFLGNASRNTVAGNRCMDDQAEPTQRYGIYISNAACKDNIVSGNTFSGNTAGDIKDLGTNTQTAQPPQDLTEGDQPFIDPARASDF